MNSYGKTFLKPIFPLKKEIKEIEYLCLNLSIYLPIIKRLIL